MIPDEFAVSIKSAVCDDLPCIKAPIVEDVGVNRLKVEVNKLVPIPTLPPILIEAPIPTPPNTVRAPVFDDTDWKLLLTLRFLRTETLLNVPACGILDPIVTLSIVPSLNG